MHKRGAWGASVSALVVSLLLAGTAGADGTPQGDITNVEATSAAGASVSFPQDGMVADGCDRTSPFTFPLGSTVVSCATPPSFAVTVVDTTDPVLGLSSTPAAVEATSSAGAAVTFGDATATDFFLQSVGCDHHSGDTFPLGVTTVKCTATDTSGNTTVGTFPVTVVDTKPPIITLPAPIVTQATTSGGEVIAYAVTAVDLVDGPVTASCLPASGSLFPVGVTTVTCNAHDAQNNASPPKTLTVTVTAAPSGSPPPPPTTTSPSPAPFQPPALTKPQRVSAFTTTPGDRRVLVSWKLPAGNSLHVELQRAVGSGTAKKIYTGPALSFVDTHLLNGSRYSYSIVVVDADGNRSDSVSSSATPNARTLVAPPPAARLSSPPGLLWVPVHNASYYNVQLYRNGQKILSIWPGANHVTLRDHWTFNSRAFTLTPGTYRWYVWPGFGAHRDKKYGSLLGNSTFQLTG
jgi:hypothetical protein